MRIKNISKKLVKPHTPTPYNLKNYQLSFLDRYMSATNFAVILFYQSKPRNHTQLLEESLAKVLVQFYPLAGRYIKNDHLVDCNDEGVEFIEAEALGVDLMDLVVAKIDTDQLSDLLPDQYMANQDHDPVMSIQASHFRCGGLAIAITVSHQVFDAASLGTFVAAWSNASINSAAKMIEFITPSFHLPSLLPYKEHDFGITPNQFKPNNHRKIVVKRLLFNKVAITSLKSKIRSKNGKPISGVRVVCACIAKALIGLDRHGNRDIIIIQPVNMRERTIPPQPKHACGNFLIMSLTKRIAAAEAKEIGIQELVDVIGDGARKSIADHAEIVSPNRDGRDVIINTLQNYIRESLNPKTNAIFFSDWSKFGFYDADFGWGKPVWTSIGPQERPRGNGTVLMSNKEGDGIEAWLHLNENDMRFYEQDEEIRLFEI